MTTKHAKGSTLPTNTKSCRTCAHAVAVKAGEPIKPEDIEAACRRYPPMMMAVTGGFQTAFPIVRLDMHCGEYRK